MWQPPSTSWRSALQKNKCMCPYQVQNRDQRLKLSRNWTFTWKWTTKCSVIFNVASIPWKICREQLHGQSSNSNYCWFSIYNVPATVISIDTNTYLFSLATVLWNQCCYSHFHKWAQVDREKPFPQYYMLQWKKKAGTEIKDKSHFWLLVCATAPLTSIPLNGKIPLKSVFNLQPIASDA